MASLAENEESASVGSGSGVDGRSGDSEGGGVGDIEAQVAAAVNQTGSAVPVPEHVVYNCRMCRRAVFNAADIQSHEVAQHNFHRRKVREKDTAKTNVVHTTFRVVHGTVNFAETVARFQTSGW